MKPKMNEAQLLNDVTERGASATMREEKEMEVLYLSGSGVAESRLLPQRKFLTEIAPPSLF
jgi:hypothetical protein